MCNHNHDHEFKVQIYVSDELGEVCCLHELITDTRAIHSGYRCKVQGWFLQL